MAAHHYITRVIMFFQSRPISYGLMSLGPGTQSLGLGRLESSQQVWWLTQI